MSTDIRFPAPIAVRPGPPTRGRSDVRSLPIFIMKTLFTAEAISKGGRSGSIKSPDGLLNITLGNP
jgi:hypothetical protein